MTFPFPTVVALESSDPSSGASRHLLPQGEKEVGVLIAEPAHELLDDEQTPPSPLEGEGARRADEGSDAPKWLYSRQDWRQLVASRTRGFAKIMRSRPTEAEARLWALLRDRRLAKYKFRRQLPMGPYIVDFACLDAKLIIEADGSQHAESGGDVARDAWLTANGYRVLRIWNNDILARPTAVLNAVFAAVAVEPEPMP